jgi:hypothetical protein
VTPGGSARPPTARSSGPSWPPTATTSPPRAHPTCARPRPRLRPASRGGAGPGSSGCRSRGYLELQAHNDALFRELELVSIELEAGDDADTPGPLADLVDQLYRRFRGQRDSYRDVVAAAQARGQETVELETPASPEAAAAAWGYLELLERADELCRTGLLLTPEPPARVKALRRWFVEQMAAQLLDGARPTAFVE